MSNLSIVTSLNQSIFDSSHQHVVESVQKHIKDFDFYVCNENSFLKEDLHIEGAKNLDIFKEIPDLQQFLETSPFKDCHKIGTKDVYKYKYNTQEYLSSNHYWNRNSIFWFRKVCSLYACSKICNSDFLIWLDSDILVKKNLNKNFFNYLSSYDVCSILRKNFTSWMFTDTGVICFNMKKLGKEFINAFYNIYKSLNAFNQYRWDDSYIFDTIVELNRDKLSCSGLNRIFGSSFDYEEYFFHDKGNRDG
jgi:hypothetical protein